MNEQTVRGHGVKTLLKKEPQGKCGSPLPEHGSQTKQNNAETSFTVSRAKANTERQSDTLKM